MCLYFVKIAVLLYTTYPVAFEAFFQDIFTDAFPAVAFTDAGFAGVVAYDTFTL